MKITHEHPLAPYLVILDKDVQVKFVTEVDTERGYYDKYADDTTIANQAFVVHRIFSDNIRVFIDVETIKKNPDLVLNDLSLSK